MKKFLAKIKEKVNARKLALMGSVMAVTVLGTSVIAHAEGEPSGSAAIQSAVTTALATTQSDAMTLIASVLPYALAIVGAVIVVTIGIRVFKKISGR